MGSLEDSPTFRSFASITEARPKPNPSDPKDQILPSDKELNKQEAKAKKRKHLEDPIAKKERRLFTRTCIVIASIGVVCATGLVAASLTLPLPIGHKGTASITGSGTSDHGQTQATGSNQRQDHADRETAEEMLNSVTSFFRNAAFLVGNEIVPKETKKSDDVQFLFPDYAFGTTSDAPEMSWKPPEYDGLYSKVDNPLIDVQPVLWETKGSGSFTLLDILTYCGRLVVSSAVAVGHDQAETLEIFSTPDNTGHYVNVNTETSDGLLRAQKLGIVESQLVHVIATPLLAETSNLFADKLRTGRIFGLLRDPVEQALSDFHQRKLLPIDAPGYLPDDFTLSQFVESNLVVPNAMTRALANVTGDTIIDENHVYTAKQILHERVVVGLQGAFDESVRRFVNYFGWTIHDPVCVANFEAARDHTSDHEQLSETSQEWKTLANRNWADKEVFEFAKTVIFPIQEGLKSANA